MNHKEFRQNYKILHSMLMLSNADEKEILDRAASAMAYIYLQNKSKDYDFHYNKLMKHLEDFDIVMGMIDERNE